MAFVSRMTSRTGTAALLLSATALIVACVWYFRSRDHRSLPIASTQVETPTPAVSLPLAERVDDSWAGSGKCAECHREISETFQTHPMAHSAASVLDATVVEDYSPQASFSRLQSRTYRVERTPEHVWHHELMSDAEGQVLFDQAVEVHYEIGSGKRGRSYVIDRGGLMTLSPIAWYTEGHRWDLSPGYQSATHSPTIRPPGRRWLPRLPRRAFVVRSAEAGSVRLTRAARNGNRLRTLSWPGKSAHPQARICRPGFQGSRSDHQSLAARSGETRRRLQSVPPAGQANPALRPNHARFSTRPKARGCLDGVQERPRH